MEKKEEEKIKGIERLKKWSAENFALWLHSGFQGLLDEKEQMTAFAPLNYYINYFDNPIDGLTSVYKELPRKAKRNFRWGLEMSLLKISQICGGFCTMTESLRGLLYLIARIQCIETLPVIVSWWEDSHKPENEEQKNLFALSLRVVSGMAPYYPGTVEAIRRIVNSDAFRPVYSGFAFMLFEALCRTEPKKFPSHLELLRQDFSIWHEKAGRSKSFITARRFVQYVDPDIIAGHLAEIKLPEDEWFMRALFVGKKAPLKIVKIKR